MLLAGNCVIYLKEVSFILISGFGFLHLLFSFLSHHKSFKSLDKRLISMDIALMISGVVFLLCYVYATANAHASYTNQEFVFSPIRTLAVSVLAAPMVSVALPCMLLARGVWLKTHRQCPNPFWDSIGLIAFGYFLAFLILGMGSFHYFMPANVLLPISTRCILWHSMGRCL